MGRKRPGKKVYLSKLPPQHRKQWLQSARHLKAIEREMSTGENEIPKLLPRV